MQKVFHHKPFILLAHLLLWAAAWSVPVLLVAQTPGDEEIWLAMIIIMTGLFYLNIQVLYPQFWRKKQFVKYTLSATAAALTASFAYNIIQLLSSADNRFWASVLIKWFMGMAFIAVGTLYRVISDQLRLQRLEQEKENENLKTELSFLRSQVSPHFMFNVLNTLVARIRQRADDLEDTVIEISNLMRYMLYDSDEEKVSIKTECAYLKSYIDLQMKRFEHSVRARVTIADDLPDRQIEPMLLIPLVENAFKHGTNSISTPEIDISLNYENGLLSLTVINSKSAISKATPKSNSGIGLENLKRRLGLLYDQKHLLVLEEAPNQYKAVLTINLNG